VSLVGPERHSAVGSAVSEHCPTTGRRVRVTGTNRSPWNVLAGYTGAIAR
jgi:hypothetical protein